MKVENRSGEWLFVAESDEENNAVFAIIELLGSVPDLTIDQGNNHGHGYNDGKPRNYVYIPEVVWPSEP